MEMILEGFRRIALEGPTLVWITLKSSFHAPVRRHRIPKAG